MLEKKTCMQRDANTWRDRIPNQVLQTSLIIFSLKHVSLHTSILRIL